MITKKYYKVIHVSYEDLNYLTLTNINNTISGFNVSTMGSPSAKNLEYSLNGADWTTYDLTNFPTVEVPANGHIYLRGNNANGFGAYNSGYMFSMTEDYKVSGNVFSLRNTNPETFVTYNTALEYEFYSLFLGDRKLKSAKDLLLNVITSVNNGSFSQMFAYCEYLGDLTVPNISTWNENVFSNWMMYAGQEVTNPTFYAPTGLVIPTNYSGIPSGWVRENY